MLRNLRLSLLIFGVASVVGGSLRPEAAAQVSETATPPAKFNLQTQRDPITSLRSLVRFQPGDDTRWASPDFDDSQWKLVPANQTWAQIGYHNLTGLAWYRFEAVLPPGDEPYALYLPQINTNYQLFADGKLLLTVGTMPP